MPCHTLTLTSSNKNGFQSNITDHKHFLAWFPWWSCSAVQPWGGSPPFCWRMFVVWPVSILIWYSHRQAKGKPGKPDKNTYYQNMHVLFNKGMGEKEIEPSDQAPPPACCRLWLMKPLAHLSQWTMLSELAGWSMTQTDPIPILFCSCEQKVRLARCASCRQECWSLGCTDPRPQAAVSNDDRPQ